MTFALTFHQGVELAETVSGLSGVEAVTTDGQDLTVLFRTKEEAESAWTLLTEGGDTVH